MVAWTQVLVGLPAPKPSESPKLLAVSENAWSLTAGHIGSHNIFGRTLDVAAAIELVLLETGLKTPADFYERLWRFVARIRLPQDRPPTAEEVALAWKRLMRINVTVSARNSLDYACVIGAFYLLTSQRDRQFGDAFFRQKMSFSRSRIEMALRFGISLFNHARRLGPEVDSAPVLRHAVTYFDRAAVDPSRLPEPALRQLLGMRGVAQILLGRRLRDAAFYRRAEEDLTKARQLGDASPQGRAYLYDCLARIHELTGDLDALARMGEMLDQEADRTRQFYADKAKFHQLNADAPPADLGLEKTTHISLGIAAASEALTHPAVGGASDAFIMSIRGRLYFLQTRELGLDPVAALEALDLSVPDLRSGSNAGFGGAWLSQALLRRGAIRKAGDLAGARADLEEAQAKVGSTTGSATRLHVQIEASLIDLEIREKIASGAWVDLLPLCQQLMTFTDHVARHGPTVARALRICWRVQPVPPSDELVQATKDLMSLSPGAADPVWNDVRTGRMLGDLASLSAKLDGAAPSNRTLKLFREALDKIEQPTATLLGQAGDASLEVARACARQGDLVEADSHYRDARDRYEAALRNWTEADTGFLPEVGHGKAGLVCLRIRVEASAAEDLLRNAIAHFEASRTLGNESVNLLGLLGDAHYRIGSLTSRAADLRQALEYKTAALAAGSETRESYSVISRIHFLLFTLEGNVRDLSDAVAFTIASCDASPLWPWPLLQLAEYGREAGEQRHEAVAVLPASVRDRPEVRWFADNLLGNLREEAVRRALQSDEFGTKILGGRSRVYVLDDPHRLLSQAIVLKPTERGNASAEISAIESLGEFLRERHVAGRFGLPTPFAMVDTTEGQVVYAMQRARAVGLERVIMGDPGNGYAGAAEVEEALKFLALFHKWADGGPGPPLNPRKMRSQFASHVRGFGFKSDAAEELARRWMALIPSSIDYARKKDAHPENWMVNPQGRIVMIDLEASSRVPVLLDVAQLLDDYPVFRADAAGWRRRLELCDGYWTRLFGMSLPADEMELGYTAFALHRCAFGIAYCGSKARQQTASSSVRQLLRRREHYVDLLAFIAGGGGPSGFTSLAGELRAALGPLSPSHQPYQTSPKLPGKKTIGTSG